MKKLVWNLTPLNVLDFVCSVLCAKNMWSFPYIPHQSFRNTPYLWPFVIYLIMSDFRWPQTNLWTTVSPDFYQAGYIHWTIDMSLLPVKSCKKNKNSLATLGVNDPVDPLDVVTNLGVDAREIWIGTTNAPGDDAFKVAVTYKRAARITLPWKGIKV